MMVRNVMAGANLPNQGEGLLGPNSVATIMVYPSAKFGLGWDGERGPRGSYMASVSL